MQLELHPEAQAETRRAAIWYDERQHGLGDRFLAAVTGTLAGIAAPPRAYPARVALKRPPMPVCRAARGLLDETLVIFSPEFGRTPFVQGTDGRDHNPYRRSAQAPRLPRTPATPGPAGSGCRQAGPNR